MRNMEKRINVSLDTTSNLLNHPILGEKQRKDYAKVMCEHYESMIDEKVNRVALLPSYMIHPGQHYKLLQEARELYIQGFFYSCIAMCGITAERILKDIFAGNLLTISNGQVKRPDTKAIKHLESFNSATICKFLIATNTLDRSLASPFKKLGELRNKYTHAGGKKPEDDSQNAINYLHDILDKTVSIFIDYKIKNGKLVPK